MEHSTNPIHRLGNKNIHCPYYEECLDHAVERRWKYWSCSKCSHKATRQKLSEVPTAHDPGDYYHVPSRIFRDLTYLLG
jgi:hypothetical protein